MSKTETTNRTSELPNTDLSLTPSAETAQPQTEVEIDPNAAMTLHFMQHIEATESDRMRTNRERAENITAELEVALRGPTAAKNQLAVLEKARHARAEKAKNRKNTDS